MKTPTALQKRFDEFDKKEVVRKEFIAKDLLLLRILGRQGGLPVPLSRKQICEQLRLEQKLYFLFTTTNIGSAAERTEILEEKTNRGSKSGQKNSKGVDQSQQKNVDDRLKYLLSIGFLRRIPARRFFKKNTDSCVDRRTHFYFLEPEAWCFTILAMGRAWNPLNPELVSMQLEYMNYWQSPDELTFIGEAYDRLESRTNQTIGKAFIDKVHMFFDNDQETFVKWERKSMDPDLFLSNLMTELRSEIIKIEKLKTVRRKYREVLSSSLREALASHQKFTHTRATTLVQMAADKVGWESAHDGDGGLDNLISDSISIFSPENRVKAVIHFLQSLDWVELDFRVLWFQSNLNMFYNLLSTAGKEKWEHSNPTIESTP